MIKYKVTGDDGTMAIGFGISEENVKRLKAGQPILVDLNEMGINANLMIFYRETDEQLIESVKPYIGKDTKVSGL